MNPTYLQDNPNLTTKSVQVARRILSANDERACILRKRYEHLGLYVINLMSSPGSGKTTFLETLGEQKLLRFAVLEGDLQTNRDAQRLQLKGVDAYQIITGEACHLDAAMIEAALMELEQQCDIAALEYLFIENVGNLVCPASYDLGAALNIVFLSTPEGDDKILKYPSMFLCADAVVISKIDLVKHFDFSLDRVKEDLANLKHNIPVFTLSAKNQEGLSAFLAFIEKARKVNYQSKHIF